MKKFIILIIIFFVQSLAFCCAIEKHKSIIIETLFNDQEFRNFVCDDEMCGKDEFGNSLEYRPPYLLSSPKKRLCIVEPIRKATNYYFGIFSFDESTIIFQFTFFGSDLKVINNSKMEIKKIVGSIRSDGTHDETHTFIWKNYIIQEE